MKSKQFSIFNIVLLVTLTLAGCRNPPPSGGMQGKSQAVRGVKSWLAAGVGSYSGSFSGTLEYNNTPMPVAGRLKMINAYRFVLAMQSEDGKITFILRRNWGGSHFLIAPAASYASAARAIGEGFSLAFRRPEGPWTAAAEKNTVIVRCTNANASRLRWWLARSPAALLLVKATASRPSGGRYVITFAKGANRFPAAMTISDFKHHYVLMVRFSNTAPPEMARVP